MGMHRASSPTAAPSPGGAAVASRGTTFGPVPSRRFGRSLGVNNIPPKVCTYSCVYCQLGRAVQVRDQRRSFHGAAAVASAVRRHLADAGRASERVDVLAFVPDGEPTLDVGLGSTIHVLRDLGIPIVVLTNGSLLFRPDVRAALSEADAVSVKVDSVVEETWRTINRPHRRLRLGDVLDGTREFASGFRGKLVTETMLVGGVNDSEGELRATAAFVGELGPATAYLGVPTRPPAERWVVPPTEAVVACAYEVFRAFTSRVELLVGYEGEAFASTGDPVEDLLAITAVHPMRERAVRRLLVRSATSPDVLDELVEGGRLAQVRYGPHRYYVRPLPRDPITSTE